MVRISVVIATYNRGEQLLRTLRSFFGQTLPREQWEVVVVNNNSTDDTAALFERFVAQNPEAANMRMVFEGAQGLSHARNRGIAESSGEYIAIVDDDEEVNDRFTEAYAELFDNYPDAAGAGGRITPLYEYTPPRWLSPIAERPIAGTLDMGPAVREFRGESFPGGGNMAVRRSVLAKVGVFDPELGRTGGKLLAGEEKDLFRRLSAAGYKIYYVPDARILHIIPESRMTRGYFTRLTRMVGVSERVRTLGKSGWAYFKRLIAECVKWAATVVLALGYLLRAQPAKAGYLFILRWNVTLGLLGFVKKQ